VTDRDLRTLERAAEASGSFSDIERLYSARVRAGELRDVRPFLEDEIANSDELRLVGEALSEALTKAHGIAWRLLSWSPQIRTSGGGFRWTVVQRGHRRYALAVTLIRSRRIALTDNGADDFWQGESLVTLGIASAPGVPEGSRRDQPPHAAWPLLGASPGNCVWTYARRSPGEPSGPQVLRCRRWASLAAVSPFDDLADDRVAIPISYARALAERLVWEGTLFA